MARGKQSVTIIDVAKAAGVSVSTVSRVINDKDDVSASTYQHVRQVIDQLGYASSLAARGMRSRSTGVVGMVMPDVDGSFCIEVMRGVNRAIVEMELDLLIYTNGDILLNNAVLRVQQYVTTLNSGITDGMIIVTPVVENYPKIAPVVAVDPNVNNPCGPAVISTNYKGASSAIKHLMDLGHRRIGYIGGREELLSSARRLKAFENAHKEAGIPLDPALVMPGDFTTETGHKQGYRLLTLEEPPTAIFASNDQSAEGVFIAASELGIQIPDELSVVGYDNTPEASYLNLTTVDQFSQKMGYVATQMLHDLIEGEPRDDEIYKIQTELVVRGSCRSI